MHPEPGFTFVILPPIDAASQWIPELSDEEDGPHGRYDVALPCAPRPARLGQ